MCSFSEERVACFLDINTQCSMEFEIQHVQLKQEVETKIENQLGSVPF